MPPPIVIALALICITMTSCGESDVARVGQIGMSPSREWPDRIACPESLNTCEGRDLILAFTVNVPRETVVNAATAGSEAHVLCRWSVTRPDRCETIGPTGTLMTGEAAIYALPAG
jgi:hypothetical protein